MAFKPTDFYDVLVPILGTNRYIRNIKSGGTIIWNHKWTLTLVPADHVTYSVSPDPLPESSGNDYVFYDGTSVTVTATPATGYSITTKVGNKILPDKYTENDDSAHESSGSISFSGNQATFIMKEDVRIVCSTTTNTHTLKLYMGNHGYEDETDGKKSVSIGIGYDTPPAGTTSNMNGTRAKWSIGDMYFNSNVMNDSSQKIYKAANATNIIKGKDEDGYYVTTETPFNSTDIATIRASGTASCYEFVGFTTERLSFSALEENKITAGMYSLTDNDKQLLLNGISFVGSGTTDLGNLYNGSFRDNQCHMTTVKMNADRKLFAWFAHVERTWQGEYHWKLFTEDGHTSELSYTLAQAEACAAQLLNDGYVRCGSHSIVHPVTETMTMDSNNPFAEALPTSMYKDALRNNMVFYHKANGGAVTLKY